MREMSTKESPLKDRFLIAALSGRHESAMDLIQQVDTAQQQEWPISHRAWLGWSFFKLGKIEESIAVYEKMLQDSPKNRSARIGMVYCLSSQGKHNQARTVLNELVIEAPEDIDILFALAFWHEQREAFLDAVLTYEKILDIKPGNHNAKRLRLRAISDLGLPSLSIEQIGELKSDIGFYSDLKLDEAAYFIRWELAEDALAIELPLLRGQPDNLRALFDYILALRQQEHYSEVKKEYEELLEKGIAPPYWVIEAVADAYLEQDDPKKAMELYRRILKQHPKSFEARMGLFYALQELRQWRSAWDLLEDIDGDTAPGYMAGKRFVSNWQKYEVGIAHGWLLAYENRLQEAETYLKQLHSSAPANTGIRTALGHVYMWRGWPRLALEELVIANTRNSDEIGAVNGKAIVMNELGFETDARKLASALYKEYPQNRHIQRLITELDIDDMREMVVDISTGMEDDDSSDLYFRTEVNEKPASRWRIFQYMLLQNSEYGDRSEAYRRLGLGFRHRFNPDWYWEEEVSFDFWDHADFGVSTSFTYTPNDYWIIDASYDTYSTNMPLRARAAGSDSDEISIGITCRESEWRACSLSFNTMSFSDGNRRNSGLIKYEQGLWLRGDWTAFLSLDSYASHNSKEDVDYFNPRQDLSISLTHMLQGTHYRHFGRSFVHRLFLTAGGYYQEDYGTHTIGAIRYEQDMGFSFRSVLLWGATLARRVYDGEPATALSMYLTFKYRF
jgi:biofilm PGA synthesis protein PgaA